MVQIENKEELKKQNSPKLYGDFKDVEDNNQRMKANAEEAKKMSSEAKQGLEPQQSEEGLKAKDANQGQIDDPEKTPIVPESDIKVNKTETKKTIEIGKKQNGK